MAMDFGKRSITVEGTTIEFNVKDGLHIVDVSNDMSNVASQMAWWSSVYASAVKELTQIDSRYRHWRASTANGILSKDPKASEWRVKAAIESNPQFLIHKDDLSVAEQNVELARGIVAAFEKKANALQSRGAMDRSRLKAIGMHTPDTSSDDDDSEDDERDLPANMGDRVSRMREINSKKKG